MPDMDQQFSFDEECLVLAQDFLEDSVIPAGKFKDFSRLLAQHIQNAIEDWMRENVNG